MTLELATSFGAAVTAYLVGYFNRNALEDYSPASCCTAPSPFCCVEAKSEIRKNFPPRITVKL